MTSTHETLWAAVLEQLAGQMTKAAYDSWLRPSRLIAMDDHVCLIEVRSAMALDWLEHQLKSVIQRVLAAHLGRSVDLRFQVAAPVDRDGFNGTGLAANLVSDNMAESQTSPEAERPPSPAETFAGVNYRAVYFEKGGSGWGPMAHYITTFWQAYLGTFNAQAYNLWFTLQKFDKRNLFKDPAFGSDQNQWWTPPIRISLRELTGMVGGASTTLTGRLTPCLLYEERKEAQIPLQDTTCCSRHQPCRWEPAEATPEARSCKHWITGAIEYLQREKILLAHIQGGSHPRQRRTTFQVWRRLPLLTPTQVTRLPWIIQIRHEQWLDGYGTLMGYDCGTWEQITETRLVELMPGHQVWQEIENNYQPNPFLPYCTTYPYLKQATTTSRSETSE